MKANSAAVLSWLALLIVSLFTPAMHLFLFNPAIEHSRPWSGFIPAQLLVWRWLGDLAWMFPVAVVVVLARSVRSRRAIQIGPPVWLFAAQLLFVSFYGTYCAFLLARGPWDSRA
ncbi:MAG: hypothetical protein U1G08_10370 [Verrucomicrobiota bacterium]